MLLFCSCQNYILWGWLRSEKETIINGDNSFKNALSDAKNYQTIETHPERMSN